MLLAAAACCCCCHLLLVLPRLLLSRGAKMSSVSPAPPAAAAAPWPELLRMLCAVCATAFCRAARDLPNTRTSAKVSKTIACQATVPPWSALILLGAVNRLLTKPSQRVRYQTNGLQHAGSWMSDCALIAAPTPASPANVFTPAGCQQLQADDHVPVQRHVVLDALKINLRRTAQHVPIIV